MSEFLSFVYDLLIRPLEIVFEVLFVVINRYLQNPGVAIIFLSLAVTLLTLPLYKRADEIQREGRRKEKELEPEIKRIKKAFSGDERFFILQTFYRQNDYSAFNVFKGSVSLFLQIPFFIAAYQMLSNLPALEGASFGPIKDFSQPDGLISIGGVAINLLPILMTVVNLLSSAVYAKDMNRRDKIQMVVVALVFLVLLYNCKSGLVLYWTMNNVFSLIKNILGLISGKSKTKDASPKEKIKPSEISFFVSEGFYLSFLTGLLIPSILIDSSPSEFINIHTIINPVMYILHALFISIGFYVIWFGVFYLFAGTRGRKIFRIAMTAFVLLATADYIFPNIDFGQITSQLQFEEIFSVTTKSILIGVAIVLAAAVLAFVIVKFVKPGGVTTVAWVFCVVAVAFSAKYIVDINKEYDEYTVGVNDVGDLGWTLSKNGQNVVVLMLDRATGFMFPYLMEDIPELKEAFTGFTYYPNTLSYGIFTNFGSPALYGGYEYTVEELNKRSSELLVDKHNEALKVMPVVFVEGGFNVTVVNPKYAGYKWIPDCSIYDEYEGITAYNLKGRLTSIGEQVYLESDEDFERNLFAYGVMRSYPSFLTQFLYDEGRYNNCNLQGDKSEILGQVIEDYNTAYGYKSTFDQAYTELDSYPEFTTVTDDDSNNFLFIANDTAHEHTLLQLPDFEFSSKVDNTGLGMEDKESFSDLNLSDSYIMAHYHAYAAALKKIAEWLDYLKENDCYDNTRIIIVADHGRYLETSNAYHVPPKYANTNCFNPLLLVKDFDSDGEYETDTTFMTNADTPTLALDGLIDNPTNPFTGNAINSDEKEGEQHVFYSMHWKTSENNGTTFIPGDWYAVNGDVYLPTSWMYLGTW